MLSDRASDARVGRMKLGTRASGTVDVDAATEMQEELSEHTDARQLMALRSSSGVGPSVELVDSKEHRSWPRWAAGRERGREDCREERLPEAAAAAALRARLRRACMLEVDVERVVVRERVRVGAPLDEERCGWGERVSMLWQRCRAEVKGEEEEGPRQAGLDGALAAGDVQEAGAGRPRGLGREVMVLERGSRGVVVLAPIELRRAAGVAMKGEVSREVVRAGAAGWEGVEGAEAVGVAGAGAVEAEEEPESETRREAVTGGQSSWAMSR